MNNFRKYISVALLVALSFLVLPKELIHEFFHHETADCILTHDTKAAVGNAHQHCDLLQLTSPPFQQPGAAFAFCISFCSFYYEAAKSDFHHHELAAALYLRGPPSIL